MPYFVEPFANSGIVAPIPTTAAPDGSVSYEMGFTELYELDLATDPSALPVPMDQFNQLMYDITTSIQQYQKFGFPEFITAGDNLGTPYTYLPDSAIHFDDQYYQSLITTSDNPSTAPAAWAKWTVLSDQFVVLRTITPPVDVFDGAVLSVTGLNTYGLAIADNSAHQNAVGIYNGNTVDTQDNNLILSGLSSSFTALTPGTEYYLSSTTPGEITSTPTAIRIGVALSTGTLLVNIQATAGFNGGLSGGFKNLKGVSTGTDTNWTVTASQMILQNSIGQSVTLSNLNVTINISASGINGLDTGSPASSTWYSVWIIHNSTTNVTAGLFSISSSTPTLPSGFTYYSRVGWVQTDSAGSYHLYSRLQYNYDVQNKVAAGSNIPEPLIFGTSPAGDPSVPVLEPVSITPFVPTTASKIKVGSITSSSGAVVINPNADYLTPGSYGAFVANGTSTLGTTISGTVEMLIESSNIYWAAAGTGFGYVYGWTDNL